MAEESFSEIDTAELAMPHAAFLPMALTCGDGHMKLSFSGLLAKG